MAGTTTVANLQANLSLNTDGFSSGVNNAAGATENLTTSILKADAVKMVLQGVADFAGKVADIVKQSVGNFSEYQQLAGGVETLFGDSADIVMNYAKEAYKTAGLNANEYMETVTSFSASLLQGLGGDTEKAAKYADRALVDMSDNVNKMGSNMSDVQNAYRGFAKQNYTMLDNLKLGYGGTQKEMQRLIQDAAKMTDVQKELGITVDASSMSFDNIINAISVVQKEMKITGTTTEEAEKTIEGSHKMMAASWENLLTSMVTGGEWFDSCIDDFIYSVKTYVKNLLPAIEGAMHGFSALISQLAPMLAEELPGFVAEILPDFVNAVTDIINGVLTALPGLLEALKGVAPLVSDALVDLIPNLITFILEGIPQVIEAGTTLLKSLISGLADNIDTIVPQLTQGIVDLVDQIIKIADTDGKGIAEAGLTLLSKLAKSLVESVPDMLTQFTQLIQDITEKIKTAADSDGISYGEVALTILKNLASNLSSSLAEVIPELTSAMAEFITEFAGLASSNTTELANSAISILNTLITNLSGAIPQVMTDLTTAALAIVDAIVDAITGIDVSKLLPGAVALIQALADGLVQSISKITEKLPELITKLVAWLTDPAHLTEMASAALDIFGTIVSNVPSIIESLVTGLTGIITGIADHFRNHGDDMVSGIADGLGKLKEKAQTIWEEKIKPAFDELGEFFKNFFSQFEWGQAALDLLGKLKEGISNAWDSIKDAFTGEDGFFGKVKSWLKSLDLLEAAKSIVESLKNGINNAWEGIKTWFSDKVKGLFDGINIDLSGLKFWEKWGKGKDKENGSETGTEEGEELGSIDMPENMITLDYNQLTPISDDVIESYQALADAIKAINAALTGQTEDDMETGMPAVGAGAEEGPVGLIGALEKIPEKMQQIMDTAKALADYLTGDFIAAIETFKKAIAVVETNDAGETNAGGGNTLYTALGAVQGVLESILTLSQAIARHWKGEMMEAVKDLKKASEIAQQCCANMASSAASAKAEFAGLAAAIRDVIAAIQELDGVEIPDLSGGGGGTGGGGTSGGSSSQGGRGKNNGGGDWLRASGGPVRNGSSYIVGEEGPELFTPNRSGYIIPNDDLFTASGGDTNITICFNGDVIGDEESISDYVTQATRRAIQEEVYAGI